MCSGLTGTYIHTYSMSTLPCTTVCITNKEYFKGVVKYMQCNVCFCAELSMLTSNNACTLTLYIFKRLQHYTTGLKLQSYMGQKNNFEYERWPQVI